MASVVQICNMALSHIGSVAQVASISPPDGSIEASYCATFYDQARTEMLEPGAWRFALARATLALLATNPSSTWAYACALPSDCMTPVRILRAGGTFTVFNQDVREYTPNDSDSADFTVEGDVLYTNEPDAVLVYVRDVTDSGKFTPGFVTALSYLLASYLAGPIIRGNEGLKIGDGMRERAMALADIAATANANASSASDPITSSIERVRT